MTCLDVEQILKPRSLKYECDLQYKCDKIVIKFENKIQLSNFFNGMETSRNTNGCDVEFQISKLTPCEMTWFRRSNKLTFSKLFYKSTSNLDIF